MRTQGGLHQGRGSDLKPLNVEYAKMSTNVAPTSKNREIYLFACLLCLDAQQSIDANAPKKAKHKAL
jgi:hypothetical protein